MQSPGYGFRGSGCSIKAIKNHKFVITYEL